jgi:hypothetical protein
MTLPLCNCASCSGHRLADVIRKRVKVRSYSSRDRGVPGELWSYRTTRTVQLQLQEEEEVLSASPAVQTLVSTRIPGEEEVTSVQPRGHDEMSTKHTETETTTDHKRWPNEGEK